MNMGEKLAWGIFSYILSICVIVTGMIFFIGRDGMPAAPKSTAPDIAVLAVSPDAPDPMARFRSERLQLREQEVTQLELIINSPETDAAIRERAVNKMIELTAFMEQEATLEGVLRMRGFEDVVCTVHRDSVNVLVRTKALSKTQSAWVMELALRETGQQSGHIKIIPVQ